MPTRAPRHRRHRRRSRSSHAQAQARLGGVVIRLSRGQLVAAVLLSLAGGGLAFEIVAATAAHKAALVNPRVALIWNADNAAAMTEQAQRCLVGSMKPTKAAAAAKTAKTAKVTTTGKANNTAAANTRDDGAPACDDLDRAAALARRALRNDPLDARALTLLGLIAERKGDAARGATLMRLAGTRTWRDPTTQIWLFEERVKQRDYAGALRHADAILRTSHAFDRRLIPSLAAFTLAPRAMRALAAWLDGDPPWRAWFLRALSRRLADDSKLVALYRALLTGSHPPDLDALKPLFARLIKDRRYAAAYAVWRMTLPPGRGGGFLHNADFARKPSGLPFDWVLRSVPGADIDIVPLKGGEGRALQVQFSGARVSFRNVSQLMRLPPGDYRLSGKMKAEGLRTRRGLRWRVSCADIFPVHMPVGLATLGHTPLLAKPVPWRNFGMDFTVPVGGCPAQWLVLALAARIGPERQIEGEVWFTNLNIVPLARREPPAPALARMCLAHAIDD